MGEELSFFPSPFPDEDFRSLIFRYHIRSGNRSFRQTKKELLNQNSIRNLHFPRNLNFFLDKLITKNITTERILDELTIFPLIAPIIPSTRLPHILEDIDFGVSIKQYNVGNLLGKGERKLMNSNIQYCPLCISDDYKLFGEVYAHRMHQLSFLTICPIHNTELIYRCAVCGDLLSKTHNSYMASTPYCRNGHKINDYKINTRVNSMGLNLYEDVYFLMNQNYRGTKEKINYYLEQAIMRKGYVWSEKVNLKRLFDDMVDNLNLDYIELIGLSKEYLLSRDVQYSMFSKNSITDIRLYILVCRFLAGSLKNFFEMEIEDELINSNRNTIILSEITQSHQEAGAARQECLEKENLNHRTLDWKKIDNDLVYKIRVTAKRVYEANPPRPIKKGTIITMLNPIDRGRIRHRKGDSLPKSIKELQSHEENLDHYILRRLPDHVNQLKEKGCKNITIRTLKAHRNLYKKCSMETIKLVEEKLIKWGYSN